MYVVWSERQTSTDQLAEDKRDRRGRETETDVPQACAEHWLPREERTEDAAGEQRKRRESCADPYRVQSTGEKIGQKRYKRANRK